MKKTIFTVLLGFLFGGCQNKAGQGPGFLDGVIAKIISRLSDKAILQYSDFVSNYGRHLKMAAIGLAALLVLIWVVRFLRKNAVKRKESQTQRAYQLVGLIDENSLEAVREKDRKLMEKLLICRLCRADSEQEIPSNIEQILKDAQNDRLLSEVTASVAKVKSKAGQANIQIHADDLNTLDSLLHQVTDIMGVLKSNIYSFATLPDIRFSTVNMFVNRIDNERENLLSLLNDLQNMSDVINGSLDKIIASQDEAIVTQVFKGSAGEVEDQIPAETAKETARLKTKMEETIGVMKQGYAQAESVEEQQQ